MACVRVSVCEDVSFLYLLHVFPAVAMPCPGSRGAGRGVQGKTHGVFVAKLLQWSAMCPVPLKEEMTLGRVFVHWPDVADPSWQMMSKRLSVCMFLSNCVTRKKTASGLF